MFRHFTIDDSFSLITRYRVFIKIRDKQNAKYRFYFIYVTAGFTLVGVFLNSEFIEIQVQSGIKSGGINIFTGLCTNLRPK